MADSQLSLSINDSQMASIKDRLNKINPENKDSVLKRLLVKVGALFEQGLKSEVTKGVLRRRSGRLANSIGFKLNSTNDVAQIGSGVRTGKRMVYANILEGGGLVKPTKKKFLAIPLPAALTASGVARKSSPRGWSDTFINRSKAGNLIIFQNRGKSSPLPLYVLKRSVTISPKEYLKKTVNVLSNKALEIMQTEIEANI